MIPVKLSIYSGLDSKTAAEMSGSWSNMNFASIADAKKYCLYYGSVGDSRHIKYFFHVSGENIDVWFTVNFVKSDRGRTPKPKLVEVYAPVIGYYEINKQHKIKEAKKKIKEWQAWLERLEEDNKERIDIIRYENSGKAAREKVLEDIRNTPEGCSKSYSDYHLGAPTSSDYKEPSIREHWVNNSLHGESPSARASLGHSRGG